jgi:hypothetical protein
LTAVLNFAVTFSAGSSSKTSAVLGEQMIQQGGHALAALMLAGLQQLQLLQLQPQLGLLVVISRTQQLPYSKLASGILFKHALHGACFATSHFLCITAS